MALLTGRTPTRVGVEFNVNDGRTQAMPTDVPTLAERFRAAGFATGLIGKWHLGHSEGRRPTERGFDEFFGFHGSLAHYDPRKRHKRANLLRGMEPENPAGWLTPAFATEAGQFIERHAANPFFLCVSFNAVHQPIEPDPAQFDAVRSIKGRQRARYMNLVAGLDDAVAEIERALQRTQLLERTLVVFVSDNGAWDEASNGGLRGGKFDLHEGGLRVPLLMRWPGRIAAGAVESRPVMTVDVAATLLAAAGIAPDPSAAIDGIDLLPFLGRAAGAAPRDLLCWRFGTQYAVRDGPLKLVVHDVTSAPELFDVVADPAESRDLAAAEPDAVARLRQRYAEWDAGNVPPLWERPAQDRSRPEWEEGDPVTEEPPGAGDGEWRDAER